jgi:hypothetical protein
MRVYRLCVAVTAAVTLSIAPSLAGPCSQEIDRLQPGVDLLAAAAAASGPPGRQSEAAMTHHQPTPSSVAAAEARLKEGERAERAKAAMGRARAADRSGDTTACLRALADVQRETGPANAATAPGQDAALYQEFLRWRQERQGR